uniref:Uncharacterized protein n=1 Tax=Clytia hemisphaerica TaxID=252671 RepID=A0A7M5V7S0_9CNID
MRIRNFLKKPSRTNAVLKFKGGSRSHKAVILDILRECRRILQKNNMHIPEWFEGTSFETGYFTNEGQFVEKKNCFPSNHSDVIAKVAKIEDDGNVVKIQDHYEGSLTGIEEPAIKTGQDIELLLKGDQVSEQIQTHIEKENSFKKELSSDP